MLIYLSFYLFSDVDTPEIDEKSLITYISSMYDVFQEPPSYHPFADEVSIIFLSVNMIHYIHAS